MVSGKVPWVKLHIVDTELVYVPPPLCNPPPCNPPPPGGTVTWPKKHRNHEVPKALEDHFL